MIELTDSKSRIIYQPLPSDDPTVRCPDISLAKQHLQWNPTVKLEQGLLKTIDYFKETLNL